MKYSPVSDNRIPNKSIAAPINSIAFMNSFKNKKARYDAITGSREKISAAFTGVVYLWTLVCIIVRKNDAKIALYNNEYNNPLSKTKNMFDDSNARK